MKFSMNVTGIKEIQRLLNPTTVKKVITRGLNRTAQQAMTEADRKVREVYNIKQRDVKKSITLKKASFNHLEAQIKAAGKKFPLIAFQAKELKPRKATKRRAARTGGVSVRIKKGQPAEILSQAFIATMPSGHTGVFERKEEGGGRVKRLPIKEMKTIGIPEMFASFFVMVSTKKKIIAVLNKNFSDAVNFYIKGRRK